MVYRNLHIFYIFAQFFRNYLLIKTAAFIQINLCKGAKKKPTTYENNFSVWSGHLFTREPISSG